MHSIVLHRNEFHPTYPLTIHFNWMVDLVTMSMRVWQMRYLVLAREDLTNQVQGRALTNKMIAAVCRFLIEEVVCRYGCVGKIIADRVRVRREDYSRPVRLLPYALWADRTTHSSVTGFMLAELMYGQKPIMSMERTISSWAAVDWRDEMSHEELLAM